VKLELDYDYTKFLAKIYLGAGRESECFSSRKTNDASGWRGTDNDCIERSVIRACRQADLSQKERNVVRDQNQNQNQNQNKERKVLKQVDCERSSASIVDQLNV
jgi:hypothetical protein